MTSGSGLVIDVQPPGAALAAAVRQGPVIVVEPLYGCVAAAAALDAGWQEVEIAGEREGQPPIPLVSFEQPPPGGASSRTCRVRADDLHGAVEGLRGELGSGAHPVLLGSPANARPACARLVQLLVAGMERVTLLPVPSHDTISADSWWSCGMLVRVLLDELDEFDSLLGDAAGMAVSLAADGTAAERLGAGLRWDRHLARGGSPHDLRVAAAVDSLAAVPALQLHAGAVRAVELGHSGS